jgi:predicted ArsR family transcriptional regulator
MTMEKNIREAVIDRISRPHWPAILRALAIHGPLPVKTIAARVGMSYMGIKQHCQELEAENLLMKEERKRKAGRPEILYFPTPEAWGLFRVEDEGPALFFLRKVAEEQGASLAEKYLWAWFRQLAETWEPGLPEETGSRWTALGQLRQKMGCILAWGQEAGHPVFWEAYSPWENLYDVIPQAVRLEALLLGQLLGCEVQRETRQRDPLPPLVVWKAEAVIYEEAPEEDSSDSVEEEEPTPVEPDLTEEEDVTDDSAQPLLFD